MSDDNDFSADDAFSLHGQINVLVIDYWTGEPLQGVPVLVGRTEDQARGKICCNRGVVTDQNGFATLRWPMGPACVFIAPDFLEETWVGSEEPVDLTFECPDFVKVIRHGFDS
jgi:hypothetical protein